MKLKTEDIIKNHQLKNAWQKKEQLLDIKKNFAKDSGVIIKKITSYVVGV